MTDDGFFNGMSPCEVGTDCTDCGVKVGRVASLLVFFCGGGGGQPAKFVYDGKCSTMLWRLQRRTALNTTYLPVSTGVVTYGIECAEQDLSYPVLLICLVLLHFVLLHGDRSIRRSWRTVPARTPASTHGMGTATTLALLVFALREPTAR